MESLVIGSRGQNRSKPLLNDDNDDGDEDNPLADSEVSDELDLSRYDPIREEEAECLAGVVPRADFVALRSQLEQERLQFLRENVALRNEVMRLAQLLEGRPKGQQQIAAAGGGGGGGGAGASGPSSSSAALRDLSSATSPTSTSLNHSAQSWRRTAAADDAQKPLAGGRPALALPSPGEQQQQPAKPQTPTVAMSTSAQSPTTALQLVPLLTELAQGLSAASVVTDIRSLAARQLKAQRQKYKAALRHAKEDFGREREQLQRQLREKDHDRGMLLARFEAERMSVQHDAVMRVDKLLCEQRRQIEEAHRDAAKHKQEVERCRQEIDRGKKAFDELEKRLFIAQQQDGVTKQERSEMYHALLQMNKEKAQMENRVTSLQAQLKHSKQELQWLSLTQSFVGSQVFASPQPPQQQAQQAQQQQQQSQRTPHLPGAKNHQSPLPASAGSPSRGGLRRMSQRRQSHHRQSVASMLGLDMLLDNAPLSAKLDLHTPRGQQHAIAEMLAATMDS